MYACSAAHKTLPLGTYVRVHNLNNDKTIEVRINDRGPFVRGRIIDLSYAAAKKIGIIDSGTAPVEIVAIGSKTDYPYTGADIPLDYYYKGNFLIQVGAFKDKKNAEKLKMKLNRFFKEVHIIACYVENENLYRVRVGGCSNLKKAAEFEKILINKGYKNVFTIAE